MSSRTRYYNRYTPYRSGVAQRARRQQRAADQQRDSTTIVINSNMSFDCGQTMAQIYMDKGDEGWYDTGCAAINIYDVLRKSDYFSEFSKLYDQFKIDNIRARIIATNWATSREESSTEKINEIIKARSYVIVTAWDRTGVSSSDIVLDPEWYSGDVTKKKMYVTIGKKIDTYSSAKTKHLGPGNAYEIVRQLYPENNYEKSMFLSTNLLKVQQIRTNTDNFVYNCYYKKVVPVEVNENRYVYEATDLKTSNPCNLISDPAVNFKPTLLVNVISGPTPMVTDIKEKDPEGFDTITSIGINKIKPVTFDVEFEVVVTFRGLRYNRNVDKIEKYITPEVRPLFKTYYIDNPDIVIDSFDISEIEISDSKYVNKAILNHVFSYGGTKSYDRLPSTNQSRYVVYLKDVSYPKDNLVEILPPFLSNKNIMILNYGYNAFTKKFDNDEIFLFDFLSDNYEEGGIDDYINLNLFKKPVGEGRKSESVYKLSKRIDIPVLGSNEITNPNTKGSILCYIPGGYKFDWSDNMEAEPAPNPNP